MTIEIRCGDRRAAFEVPFRAYADAPNYVTPMWSDFDRILDPARNPLCVEGRGRLELFTAHRDGAALGRIVASIHDASNARHGTQRGQFGFFDLIDEDGVADALLNAAERWCAERGAAEIVGNFNLTAMQMAGVVTSGFENAPHTDMMWSPPHVAAQLRRAGYEATFPMTTFEIDLRTLDPAALADERSEATRDDPDFAFLPITRKTFRQRLEDARVTLNAGFDSNPMFVPLTPEEYQFQAGEMMWIMDPRLSVVAHHRGEPVGVVVCIPDLNPFVKAQRGKLGPLAPLRYLRHRLTRRRAVIVYYSVAPQVQGRGLNRVMLAQVIAAARKAGYDTLGCTWIADVNAASLKQMQRLGARPLHRLHLFRKPLEAQAG